MNRTLLLSSSPCGAVSCVFGVPVAGNSQRHCSQEPLKFHFLSNKMREKTVFREAMARTDKEKISKKHQQTERECNLILIALFLEGKREREQEDKSNENDVLFLFLHPKHNSKASNDERPRYERFSGKRKTKIIVVFVLLDFLPFNCRTNIVLIAKNENNLRAA